MQDVTREEVLSIQDDLRYVAELAGLRFVHESEERRRVARMREVLMAAAEVNRSLTAYLHHALVDCHGTRGAADLDADAIALGEALGVFSMQVRDVSDEYRSVIADAVASVAV